MAWDLKKPTQNPESGNTKSDMNKDVVGIKATIISSNSLNYKCWRAHRKGTGQTISYLDLLCL
jgi:hypothetical protein